MVRGKGGGRGGVQDIVVWLAEATFLFVELGKGMCGLYDVNMLVLQSRHS